MSYYEFLSFDKNILLYRPELNKITGSPIATLLLCQIIYWSSKCQHKEFYKNIYQSNKQARDNKQKSWKDELGFNRYQIEKAIDILRSKDIIDVRVVNSSHNTYVKLNAEKLEKELEILYKGRKKKEKAVAEGKQRTVAEGEQPPLSKVNNRTITDTTQRLHREKPEDFLLRTFSKEEDRITEYKIRKMMKELKEDERRDVRKRAKQFLEKYPQMKDIPTFKLGILHAYIKRYLEK